jgi:hypothetical protein
MAKHLLEWGGGQLGWSVVILIAIAAMAVSAYKIRNTGTRWGFAFNFGILCAIVYDEESLV